MIFLILAILIVFGPFHSLGDDDVLKKDPEELFEKEIGIGTCSWCSQDRGKSQIASQAESIVVILVLKGKDSIYSSDGGKIRVFENYKDFVFIGSNTTCISDKVIQEETRTLDSGLAFCTQDALRAKKVVKLSGKCAGSSFLVDSCGLLEEVHPKSEEIVIAMEKLAEAEKNRIEREKAMQNSKRSNFFRKLRFSSKFIVGRIEKKYKNLQTRMKEFFKRAKKLLTEEERESSIASKPMNIIADVEKIGKEQLAFLEKQVIFLESKLNELGKQQQQNGDPAIETTNSLIVVLKDMKNSLSSMEKNQVDLLAHIQSITNIQNDVKRKAKEALQLLEIGIKELKSNRKKRQANES